MALAGSQPEGSPAESPPGEVSTALPPSATTAGPGPVEGAPSGLRQEEGEAGSNAPSPAVRPNYPGQETASQEDKVLSAELRASSMGAAWLGVLWAQNYRSLSGMAGGKPASDQVSPR